MGEEQGDPAVAVDVRRGPEGFHQDGVVLGELAGDRSYPFLVDVVRVLPQIHLDESHDAIVDRRDPGFDVLAQGIPVDVEGEGAAVPDLVLHRRRLARPGPGLLQPQGQLPLAPAVLELDGVRGVGRRGPGGFPAGPAQEDVVRRLRVRRVQGRRVEGENHVPVPEVEVGLETALGIGPQVHQVG